MKIPVRRGILSSILLLLLVATSSIWAAGDWSARKTASSLVDTLAIRLGDSVSERVTRQIQPAMTAAKSVSLLLEAGVVSIDSPEALLDLLETKAKVSSIDRIYVGSDDGRFFMAATQGDGRVKRRTVRPAEALQYWTWTDEAGIVHHLEEEVSYDPRERGWYTQAASQGESWTDVYRFQSDNQPGITASVPARVQESGLRVAGADVTLVELSRFLSKLEVSPNGRAFLLDGRGNLVAHPDASLVLGQNGGLIAATDAADPIVRAAAGRLGEGGGVGSNATDNGSSTDRSFTIRLRGEDASARWRLLLMPLATGEGIPAFTLGVAIPEADFLGTLHRTRLISAIIAVFSIGLGVLLAFVFSRGIARPIQHLERSMSRVGSFDLDVDTKVETVYVELQQMVCSFERMVGGLRSFSRYVPRDLVRDLVGSGRQAELGGEERELSIYFSDIAGFTTLSERMDPQELVAQLGEYFEDVVSALKAQGATIDKFIGDAVMALWNAPRPNPNHPLGAALGAIDVVSTVARLNERWEREGRPPFHTRIGISTAKVVVGNVGSSHRLAYTALGDGVNLAARLEGANKHYQTNILASEGLVSRLPPGIIVAQPLDVLVVKGKAKGVRIYEILGRRSEVTPARLEAAQMYEAAFKRYLAMDFEEAARLFRQVLDRLPGYRPAEDFLERCRLFLEEPPSEGWDGSFVLMAK